MNARPRARSARRLRTATSTTAIGEDAEGREAEKKEREKSAKGHLDHGNVGVNADKCEDENAERGGREGLP
eukprot:1947669-Alexandrium_andersonii.AAC.1